MIDSFYIIGLGLIILFIAWNRFRRIRFNQLKLEMLVDQRTSELRNANTAKDLFWANFIHEISNPMNGLIGIVQAIKTESLDTETKHKLELLGHCATHVSSLLDDVHKFPGAHTSEVSIEAKPFAVSDLTVLLKALTLAESERYRAQVEITVSPESPKRLVGDARRISQILQNFISNSLKHSGSKQVRVAIWCEKSSDETSKVFFVVSDDGAGIPADEQAKLFIPFQRGQKARHSNVPGTGLGLAICKTLAERMGGCVWVESEPGKGSRFSFSATFQHASDSHERALTQLPVIDLSLKKALVVDDEEYNRIALSGLLETLGLSTQCASNDRDVLTLASANDFDLIFLDYSMPGLNGPEIAQAIRAIPGPCSRALIFATTAFNTREIQDQCMAAGINAFINKPVTIDRIRGALNTLAGRTQAVTHLMPQPADKLVNLRILAAKKNIPFSQELTLYFSEFDLELKQLVTALREESSTRLKYHTHLLYGRCSFIREREIEQTVRKIETLASGKNWLEARLVALTLQTETGDLRVRLFSEIPIVQHV